MVRVEEKLKQEAVTTTYYLYCIIPVGGKTELGKNGIGGPNDQVYTIEYKDIAAVVSNPSQGEFERSEDNIMAHQRVVQRAFEEQPGVPLAFPTTANSEMDVQQLLEEHYAEFKEKLTKLGDLKESATQAETEEGGARELLEETLTQSAASAVRIRQLNEEISQLRSMRYEKAMETAADLITKKLSTQLSTSLDSLNRTVGALQEKLSLIQANMYQMKTERNIGGQELSQLPSADDEIRLLREELEHLNRRGFEELLTPRVKAGS